MFSTPDDGTYRAGFPNARLDLIEGGGHAPWLGDPAAIADLLGPFLSA